MATANVTIQTFLDFLATNNIALMWIDEETNNYILPLSEDELLRIKQEFIVTYFPEEAA